MRQTVVFITILAYSLLSFQTGRVKLLSVTEMLGRIGVDNCQAKHLKKFIRLEFEFLQRNRLHLQHNRRFTTRRPA